MFTSPEERVEFSGEKIGSVDYAECGVWSAKCGECGVWKMRSVENAEWNVNKLIKKTRCIIAFFLDAQFVLYTNAPVYTNVLTCDQAPLMSLRTTRRPTTKYFCKHVTASVDPLWF